MPSYYPSYPPVYGSAYGSNVYPSYNLNPYNVQAPQYMINVDGEVGAKAWQPPANLAPNTVIPLWDIDGKHVYFKSVDAYGRLNPMRKGTVIFEDEQATEAVKTEPVDLSSFVTKEEFNELKALITKQSKTNQNGSKTRGDAE